MFLLMALLELQTNALVLDESEDSDDDEPPRAITITCPISACSSTAVCESTKAML